jgi:hypothetical protein
MVLESLVPVFALIAMGAALKHHRLISADFLTTTDRLVYYIFFPLLLFWKIGAAPASSTGSGSFYLAVVLAVLVIYLASLVYIRWRIPDFQAGAFSQSCYRFNTYIGMAIILNTFGEEAARQFGMLIGCFIPINNVLAVATLTWYARAKSTARAHIVQTLRAMLTNPLIIGCVSGLVYARLVGAFPAVVDNTLALLTAMTLPLALLSIGGGLRLTGFRDYWRPALAGAGFKLLGLPLVGGLLLHGAAVSALEFKIGMLYFALPISPATYVLTAQLNSDTGLASVAIVMTTALSVIPLALVLTLLG